MPDFHVPTIRFLNTLLKAKQLALAKAAHTPEFEELQTEFELLRQRLCLEITYAMESES
jgi:hypothetical protein